MRRARLLVLAVFALTASILSAEEVVLGLSSDQVSITTRFNGSEILIFGAVKRESPIPQDAPLEVVITVSGPSQPVIVRKKSRRAGIWVNTNAAHIDQAPSFYAVATTGPLDEVLSATENLRHKVSIERAIRAVGAASDVRHPEDYTEALIRIRSEEGLYQQLEGAVVFDQQTLFRTAITMPSNLTEGDYATRIFLTRAGKVVSDYETTIDVRKVGLERWLFAMSRQQPMLYGLMSLLIAIGAGWCASTAFTLLRR